MEIRDFDKRKGPRIVYVGREHSKISDDGLLGIIVFSSQKELESYKLENPDADFREKAAYLILNGKAVECTYELTPTWLKDYEVERIE